jgi:hypothetical protein
MDKSFTDDLQQLITRFQDAWVYRQAWRIVRAVEVEQQTPNWEKALEAARTLSQDIFPPALADLESGAPPPVVVGKLVERLKTFGKPPSHD